MIVSRADLEESLARVRAAVAHPAHGLYGPGSIAWTIDKEAVLFLGGGRAALLQLAHPFVAYAVDQHSQTRVDPQGRFVRTFVNVFNMVFGDLDAAIKSARAVHNIHSRITGEIPEDVGSYPRGTPYAANDADALMWVHATLVHTAVRTYELIVRRLTDDERERYYRESRRFAYLFGIPDSVQPPTWRDFDAYVEDMLASDKLGVGTAAAEMGSFLFQAPRPSLAPVMRWYRAMTAWQMPPRFREPFGLTYGRAERALVRASLPALRAGYRFAPRPVRYVPAYVSARRRLAGRNPDHPMQRLADRLVGTGLRRKPAAA